MTKRIFWSTLLAQIVLIIVSTILTVRASFVISESSQRVQLREVAEIISHAYETSGDIFIAEYAPKGYNITLINDSGKIINANAENSWYLVTDANALVDFLSRVVDSNDIVESHAHILTGELPCA
ncbi:MAG: hypothetical protein KBS81_00610 [Spirochaetales bacterium]|nr:hypothetical protein [Candidatus Physcosoma equi]